MSCPSISDPVGRIIVLFVLGCSISLTTVGQNSRSRRPRGQIRTAVNAGDQKSRASQPKPESARLTATAQTVTREKYDPAKNETTIDVPSMQVFGEQLDGLRMFVSFSFPGRKMQGSPDAVTLIVASSSTSPKYEDTNQRNLTAWADGQSLDFGRMQLFYTYRGLGYVTEGMKLAVPVKTFTQIVNAQQVKLKLGWSEFQLRESHLDALRELGRRADAKNK
jgi:hypothetical protein